MSKHCTHTASIAKVVPSALGCEECLKIGSEWVHLRLCRTCGHVGCCDDSPHRHATAHFHATEHPIIEGYDPPEGWGWCFVDRVMVDLQGDTTPSADRFLAITERRGSWATERRIARLGGRVRIVGLRSPDPDR